MFELSSITSVLVSLIALVIAIIAVAYRGSSIASLNRRLTETEHWLNALESEIRRLHRRIRQAAPSPERESQPSHEAVEVLPAAVQVPVAPPAPSALPTSVQFANRDNLGGSANVESFIGKRVLGWIAVALLVLAVSFFLRYAFENNLIGEMGRVSIGVVIGTALCIFGWARNRRGDWRATVMLAAAGLLILYLSLYASFGIYRLMPPMAAGFFLFAVVAEAVGLGLLFRARSLCYLAVLGGLLIPVLLPSERDPYLRLFAYLAVLNIAAIAVTRVSPHPALRLLTYLGTQVLFWSWFLGNYHPEKIIGVVAFQIVLYGIYLIPHLLERRPLALDDAALLLMKALMLFVALHRVWSEGHPEWMGTMAVVFALVYLIVLRFDLRFAETDMLRPVLDTATALFFTALILPMQAKAEWIAPGWAVEGAVLWWFGLRTRQPFLRGAGAVLLGLACIALPVNFPANPRMNYPIFNHYTPPAIAVALGFLAAAWSARVFDDRLTEADSAFRYIAGIAAALIVWGVLTWETWNFFFRLNDFSQLAAQTAMSIVWALYASVLLIAGFLFKHAPTRWLALGLFGVTLLKLLTYDLSELEGIYRVLTFLAAALLLAAAAWGYHRIQLSARGGDSPPP